jgi:hypothetical protein
MARGAEMGEAGRLSVSLAAFLYYNSDVFRVEDVQLSRFQGKPGTISPKARVYLFAGWLFPSHFKWVNFAFLLVTD